MTSPLHEPKTPTVELPVDLVADVQDALLTVVNDLNRLDRLLTHAMDQLMQRFEGAQQVVAQAPPNEDAWAAVEQELHGVITELQFQDMASQLINHTLGTLQGCAFKLAAESMDREDGEALPFVDAVPERPNPVTQDEMHAGSIELF